MAFFGEASSEGFWLFVRRPCMQKDNIAAVAYTNKQVNKYRKKINIATYINQ